MINKIKQKIKESLKLQQLSYLQLKELEWAHIYHDSIRGEKPLEELSLNIGRWAGNYAFFYILNRILSDYKPKSILELGLGESTKFISTYLDSNLPESNHTVVEHDKNWKSIFLKRFKLFKGSEIQIFEKVKKTVKGHEYIGYDNIESKIQKTYNLYIVDGPFGSENYSRYDIVNLASKLTNEDEFIIILDDYDRKGEKETSDDLIELLKEKKIEIFTKVYIGNKSVNVIATKQYKYATSL